MSKKDTELAVMGRKASRAILAICILLTIGEFVIHRHSYSEAEAFPLFYGLFGFIAFISIVLAGILLREFVMRDKDYYDAD